MTITISAFGQSKNQDQDLKKEIEKTLSKAADHYGNLAVNGGYVYYYSLDNKRRLGEGVATRTQVWVQPPGTPTVGEAFLDAYEATGEPKHLELARAAGRALAYGQLKSGGWTNSIDFDPKSKLAGLYRNGRGKGKNNSSLDDDQSGSALRFLVRLNQALKGKDRRISEALEVGLKSLLDAQFPNGAFPQVWTKPVERYPIVNAQYPEYDWKTENRIKNYWDLYTINDNVTGSVARTLIVAHQASGKKIFLDRLKRLGDFLIRAQMPIPQRGWAQQYDYQMRPVWARRFEPPALGSDETQETIETLLLISVYTKDVNYLPPIPGALRWLEKSKLNKGDLARYYELKTNRPLYMNRNGKNYFLTYSDKNLPSHYGWKIRNRTSEIRDLYEKVKANQLDFEELLNEVDGKYQSSTNKICEIVDSLDSKGRWVTLYKNQKLVGQPKFARNEAFLSSRVFADNVKRLSNYLKNSK